MNLVRPAWSFFNSAIGQSDLPVVEAHAKRYGAACRRKHRWQAVNRASQRSLSRDRHDAP